MKTKIENQSIKVSRGSVFVRSWEPENSLVHLPPLLLFHDSLGSVEAWGDFPKKLSHRLKTKVLAYDRIGFGQSSAQSKLPPLNFITLEASHNLPELLTKLEINKLIAFGHSVGGAMALLAAKYLPHKIRLVISESAQSYVEKRTIEGIKTGSKFFLKEKGQNWLKKFHGGKSDWVLRSWTDLWLSEEFKSWSLKEELSQVHCPSLILHGDQDEYGSLNFPKRIKEWAKGPAQVEILKGLGHFPHNSQPEQILDLVNAFLEEHKHLW